MSKRDIRTFTSFTQNGAARIALFYKSIGKKIVSNPEYNAETTLWHFDVHWNP